MRELKHMNKSLSIVMGVSQRSTRTGNGGSMKENKEH